MLIYDIITNVGFAILFNVEIIVALALGVWFMLVHVISNTVMFGAVFSSLVKIVGDLAGENVWSYRKERL